MASTRSVSGTIARVGKDAHETDVPPMAGPPTEGVDAAAVAALGTFVGAHAAQTMATTAAKRLTPITTADDVEGSRAYGITCSFVLGRMPVKVLEPRVT